MVGLTEGFREKAPITLCRSMMPPRYRQLRCVIEERGLTHDLSGSLSLRDFAGAIILESVCLVDLSSQRA